MPAVPFHEIDYRCYLDTLHGITLHEGCTKKSDGACSALRLVTAESTADACNISL